MTLQDGGIEKLVYRSDSFQNDVCTAAGLAREVSLRRRRCLLVGQRASALSCHLRTAKKLVRELHVSWESTTRTRKENLSFFHSGYVVLLNKTHLVASRGFYASNTLEFVTFCMQFFQHFSVAAASSMHLSHFKAFFNQRKTNKNTRETDD